MTLVKALLKCPIRLARTLQEFFSKFFFISSQILSTLIATSQQQEQVATLGISCRHDMDCSDHVKGSYCSLDSVCECSPFYVMFNATTCLPCKCFGLKFTASLDLTRNVSVNRVSEEYWRSAQILTFHTRLLPKKRELESKQKPELINVSFSATSGQRLRERRAVFDACCQQRLPRRSVSMYRGIPSV